MIPTPGIYADIPDREYFSWEAVSQSALKTILKSPAEYLYRQQRAREPSTEMTVGSALDALVTGPTLGSYTPDAVAQYLKSNGFAFELEAEPNRRTKEYQTWKKERLEEGLEILSHELLEGVLAMYEALDAHPEASILLTDRVEPQASIVWADPETGILCKGRIDATSTDGSTLHDLKTTRENHPQGFAKSIAEYGYHFQAACYLEGIQVASEGAIAPEKFCLHAVRNTPVYCVESYQFGGSSLYIGREEFHRALRILKECQETDTWPATTGRLHPIDLPGYYHQVKGDRWANLEWEVSP